MKVFESKKVKQLRWERDYEKQRADDAEQELVSLLEDLAQAARDGIKRRTENIDKRVMGLIDQL